MTPSPHQQVLLESGRLIEAGWVGWSTNTIDPRVPSQQMFDMRLAFFAGAHYLFVNMIAATKRKEGEPSVVDFRMIDREFQEFIGAFNLYQVPVAGSG